MKTTKAPSPWPPRVWIKLGKSSQESMVWPFSPAENADAYLSLEEHSHLLAEAVREALRNIEYQLQHYGGSAAQNEIDKIRSASELRTAENGGKE